MLRPLGARALPPRAAQERAVLPPQSQGMKLGVRRAAECTPSTRGPPPLALRGAGLRLGDCASPPPPTPHPPPHLHRSNHCHLTATTTTMRAHMLGEREAA